MYEILVISDLHNSYNILLNNISKKYIITNPSGSINYMGIFWIDKVFKNLLSNFNNIKEVIVNVDDNISGLYGAIRLGYKNIKYTGNSKSIKEFLCSLKD